MWSWIKTIALAVLIALLIRAFFLEVVIVDGESMYPTLKHGERLAVNKLTSLLGDPERGDIVVFRHHSGGNYVKRVIALGGDAVRIEGGALRVSGLPLEEDYLFLGEMNDFGPISVPGDHAFLLGDNRPVSFDSRLKDMGFIHVDDIKGKAIAVFWPPQNARLVD